jgi:hypothetical protein
LLQGSSTAGSDVMLFKYFRRKNLQKLAFLTQNKAKFLKN